MKTTRGSSGLKSSSGEMCNRLRSSSRRHALNNSGFPAPRIRIDVATAPEMSPGTALKARPWHVLHICAEHGKSRRGSQGALKYNDSSDLKLPLPRSAVVAAKLIQPSVCRILSSPGRYPCSWQTAEIHSPVLRSPRRIGQMIGNTCMQKRYSSPGISYSTRRRNEKSA